jgi:murein L,D-transpeptidase YcbB/YkuD
MLPMTGRHSAIHRPAATWAPHYKKFRRAPSGLILFNISASIASSPEWSNSLAPGHWFSLQRASKHQLMRRFSMNKLNSIMAVGLIAAGTGLALAPGYAASPAPNSSQSQPPSGQMNGTTQHMQQSGSRMHTQKEVSQSKVEDVQKALNNNGASIRVDGVLGPQTRSALKRYQKEHGLKVTGQINANTEKKMNLQS